MKNKIIIALLALSLLLVGCSNNTQTTEANDLEEIEFVLDWTPNTNHIGVYVADELGYYEEAGIDLKIIQPPEDGPELLIGAGEGDIGVSFQDSLAAVYGSGQNIPITAIAALLQHNTSGIISKVEDGIERPKDLQGKSYASSNWQMGLAILEEVVIQDGGDWDQVEIVPVTATDEVSTLKSDLADSIWVYYGWGGIATELAGIDTNYFAFKDIESIFDYYTPVLIANNKFLEENPDLVRNFLQATEKGYKYAISKPDQAGEILVQADSALDKDLVVESIKYLSDYYIEEGIQWGYIDQKRWDQFFQWAYEKDLIENKIQLGHGMSNEYLSNE